MGWLLAAGCVVWVGWTLVRVRMWRRVAIGAWHDLDAPLTARDALIPQLLAAAAVHTGTDTARARCVEDARRRVHDAASPRVRAMTSGLLCEALEALLAAADRAPAAQTDERLRGLRESLSRFDASLAQGQRYYNAVAAVHNRVLHAVPTRYAARLGRWTALEPFAEE